MSKKSIAWSVKNTGNFSLFVKSREMRQLLLALEHAMVLPPEEKKLWFDVNGDMLHDAFDQFLDDSSFLFDRISLDDESLELSQELISSLRTAVNIIENLSQRYDTLES